MKKAVTITLSETAITIGKEDAKKVNRSFSNYIEILILENGERKTIK